MKRLALALALALCSFAAAAAINLNTATKEELVALPGIGPSKAQAILDHRNTHGPFKAIEELKDVKGIGAKRYEKIKAELTVVAAPPKPAAKPAEVSPPQRMATGYSAAGVSAAAVSPTLKRTKRDTEIFSPSFAIFALITSETDVVFSLMKGCSYRHTSS